MKVSVIIPLFNTELYIEQCVRSCMIQQEVGQIIIVNDGSNDQSISIVETLLLEDDRVELYHHPDRVNKGAGQSRNLGIKKANCQLINFLDADDYYLPKRFEITIQTLKNSPLDGVYETIKVLKEDSFPNEYTLEEYGVSTDVKPKNSLDVILDSNRGSVCIHGFTFTLDLIKTNNIHCLDLKRAQELDMLFEACVKGSVMLKSGPAVGMRRLHATNSILNNVQGDKDRVIFYNLWFHKMLKYKLGPISNLYFFKQRLHYDYNVVSFRFRLLRNVYKSILAIYLLLRHPTLLFKLIF